MAISSGSKAHDHDRPELQGWFKTLESKGKSPCCDGTDAARVDDADWESRDGHYRVRVPPSPNGYGVASQGEWIDVPDNAVVEEPNRDGRTLVWLYYFNGLPVVRCFLPGSMT